VRRNISHVLKPFTDLKFNRITAPVVRIDLTLNQLVKSGIWPNFNLFYMTIINGIIMEMIHMSDIVRHHLGCHVPRCVFAKSLFPGGLLYYWALFRFGNFPKDLTGQNKSTDAVCRI